jgi:hypothetical protein
MPVQIPYPYFELEFDASGKPTDAKQLPALIDGLKKSKTTDLFVISHGWNNDEKDAHALYQELFNNVKAQEKNVDVTGRTFAVAGIIWPSKKFDAAEDAPNAASIGRGTTGSANRSTRSPHSWRMLPAPPSTRKTSPMPKRSSQSWKRMPRRGASSAS